MAEAGRLGPEVDGRRALLCIHQVCEPSEPNSRDDCSYMIAL